MFSLMMYLRLKIMEFLYALIYYEYLFIMILCIGPMIGSNREKPANRLSRPRAELYFSEVNKNIIM
jgi:hypothetical protein